MLSLRALIGKLTNHFSERRATDVAAGEVGGQASQLLETQAATKTASIDDGWIWCLGVIGNVSEREIQEWEEEGMFFKRLQLILCC